MTGRHMARPVADRPHVAQITAEEMRAPGIPACALCGGLTWSRNHV